MRKEFKRQIIITDDGSTTIHLPDWNEQYHSKHGAINEAKHVFIKSGLHYILETQKLESIDLLEIGFGTGLNAFITFLETMQTDLKIHYCGVEGYPVSPKEAKLMNYPAKLEEKKKEEIFDKMHADPWELPCQLSSAFTLVKRKQLFSDIIDQNQYHLIYFDAFGARVQPELWTVSIFQKMYDALRDNGVLVTYAAKGSVRRAMKEVGFDVERLPGPPGKREMLRATKA